MLPVKHNVNIFDMLSHINMQMPSSLLYVFENYTQESINTLILFNDHAMKICGHHYLENHTQGNKTVELSFIF